MSHAKLDLSGINLVGSIGNKREQRQFSIPSAPIATLTKGPTISVGGGSSKGIAHSRVYAY